MLFFYLSWEELFPSVTAEDAVRREDISSSRFTKAVFVILLIDFAEGVILCNLLDR